MEFKAPRVIKDENGKEWTLKVTAGSIMRACRNTGLTIQSLMDMQVGIDHILSALPFFCEKEIKAAGMTHDEFLDLFGIKEITDVVLEFFPALAESFPEAEEKTPTKEGEDDAPLESAGLVTTS